MACQSVAMAVVAALAFSRVMVTTTYRRSKANTFISANAAIAISDVANDSCLLVKMAPNRGV